MSGLTFGHMLYAFAAIEIVVAPLLALNMMRSNPDVPARSAYIVIAAAIVSALALCGVATFTEFGRIPIS
jgi:hypothetical protein